MISIEGIELDFEVFEDTEGTAEGALVFATNKELELNAEDGAELENAFRDWSKELPLVVGFIEGLVDTLNDDARCGVRSFASILIDLEDRFAYLDCPLVSPVHLNS